MHRCESIHGECEVLNQFTVAKKCPKGFIRDDISRCVRDCELEKSSNSNIIILDKDCNNYTSYYLSQKKFESEQDCLQEFISCRTTEEKSFTEDCQLNYKRVAFLCVPYCYDEMGADLLEEIRNSNDYCLEDVLEMGAPLYDL